MGNISRMLVYEAVQSTKNSVARQTGEKGIRKSELNLLRVDIVLVWDSRTRNWGIYVTALSRQRRRALGLLDRTVKVQRKSRFSIEEFKEEGKNCYLGEHLVCHDSDFVQSLLFYKRKSVIGR